MERKPSILWMMAHDAPLILWSLLSLPAHRATQRVHHWWTLCAHTRRRRPWTIHGSWKP